MENLADIAGSSATAALATPNVTARWFAAVVTGGGTVRIGGPTTSSTVGLPITSTNGVVTFPVITQESGSASPYSLGEVKAYVPAGSTLSVVYEPWN